MQLQFVSKKSVKLSPKGDMLKKATYKTDKYWIDISDAFGVVDAKFTSSTGIYGPGILYDPISKGCLLLFDGSIQVKHVDAFIENVKEAAELADYCSQHLQEMLDYAQKETP